MKPKESADEMDGARQTAPLKWRKAAVGAVDAKGRRMGAGLASGLGLLALGRNPSAGNEIRTNMVLEMVFAEAIARYALVVAMIILFVPM